MGHQDLDQAPYSGEVVHWEHQAPVLGRSATLLAAGWIVETFGDEECQQLPVAGVES